MADLDRRVQELIRIYSRAEAQIDALVATAVEGGRTAQARYRNQVRSRVSDILRRLKSDGKPAAERVILSAYEQGLTLAHREGDRKALRGGFGGPHRPAIDALAASLTSRLDEAASAVGRSVDDVFRRETLRTAAERLARGDTAAEGARALEMALRRRGITAFVDSRGRQWRLEDYASMAITTVTAQAQTEATKNRMLEQGYDLVTITKHLHKADSCSPYDGKTFSLTGATPGYPVIDKLPPFHPRCRHRMRAARENFLAQEDLLREQVAA